MATATSPTSTSGRSPPSRCAIDCAAIRSTRRAPPRVSNAPWPRCSRIERLLMAGPTEAAGTGSDATDLWADALGAAHVLAVDPAALGGLLLRAGAGPVRDAWLDLVQQLLPPGTPWRRMPVSIADD